jgi:hypothetical protein
MRDRFAMYLLLIRETPTPCISRDRTPAYQVPLEAFLAIFYSFSSYKIVLTQGIYSQEMFWEGPNPKNCFVPRNMYFKVLTKGLGGYYVYMKKQP